jgi:hypothetical protein
VNCPPPSCAARKIAQRVYQPVDGAPAWDYELNRSVKCYETSGADVMFSRQNSAHVQRSSHRRLIIAIGLAGAVLSAGVGAGHAADPKPPKGFYGFGADQTIVDIGKVEWQPLKLEGLPPGMEIATLRGDLAKGGGEILLRLPINYTVPNHSHTSDELYVWLKGAFTYIAEDGKQVKIDNPAYVSLPGKTPHALKCHDEPCIFYVRYGRAFDLHMHAMPK